MPESYFHRVQRGTPTRLWVNNPTLAEAERALALGAIACTTNPTYAAKILPTLPPAERQALLAEAMRGAADADAAVDAIQNALVARLLPVVARARDAAQPLSGLVSIQGNPHRDTDSDHILHEAARHAALGPNVILKIPVTRAGLIAIEELLSRGNPVLATEMMSLAQTRALCGCFRRAAARSAATPVLIATHITGIYDEYLVGAAAREAPELGRAALDEAGFLVARRVRAELTRQGLPIALMGGGARRPRHFTDMVGGALHVTINPDTIDGLVAADAPAIDRFSAASDAELVALLRARLPDFRRAWDDDGLAPEEFEQFGPVRFFLAMFTKGWDAVRDQFAPRSQAAR